MPTSPRCSHVPNPRGGSNVEVGQVAIATVRLDPQWTIAGNSNGGYLGALISSLAAEVLGAPAVTFSVHYLAAGRAGAEVTVRTEVLRVGRLSTVRVEVRDAEAIVLSALVTCGVPKQFPQQYQHLEPPRLPPWAECGDMRGVLAVAGNELLEHLEIRADPPSRAILTSRGNLDYPAIAARVAYRDGTATDRFLVASAWDVLAPTSWLAGHWGGAPTVAAQVELFPGEPARGPLVVRCQSDAMRAGMVDETAHVWDAAGSLVAVARQTALFIPA